MKGLEINDLLVALMANHIVINDDLYAAIKEIENAGYRLSDECDEKTRQLTATITFSYAPHDDEDDPQPAPAERHQPWQPTNTPPVETPRKPMELTGTMKLALAADMTYGEWCEMEDTSEE